jgi:hypothetical protein
MDSSQSTPESPPLPPLSQLWRATAVALVAAAAILATIVLPAEYGIDPTGAGAALGLLRVSEASSARVTTDSEAASREPAPFRTDETTITLYPGEGVEIKASMRRGERFVFTWTTDGDVVDFDMHGEAFNATDNYTSYWKDEDQPSASGSFEAPFDGLHGWFWQNLGPEPVAITLTTSGFYNELVKLVPP